MPHLTQGLRMTSNHLPYWLAALYLPGVGPRTLMGWMEQFPDIEKLFQATDAELRATGLSARQIQDIRNPDWRLIDKDLEWAGRPDCHILTIADECYPYLLKQIWGPPLVLFARGNKAALAQPQIAVVGARNATLTGLQNAEWFAATLAQVGYVITSGLALGVDGAGHRGTLAAGGITIGVSGTGLYHTYPSSHQSLVRDIITHNGLVISEFPLNTRPFAANFPRRNRIISGLSLGVLVVEAAPKSGSLITARHALDHGREVFAIPGSIHNPLAKGCHQLIRQGAKLVETVADIVEELGEIKAVCVSSRKPPMAMDQTLLSHEHRQLLDQIGYEITPMDVILLRCGLTAGEVSSILLTLELYGYIQSVPGGYIRAILNQ
jgi:DNA processing protein